MILAKTWYKTHNGKLLVIVKVSKICKHYLGGYEYKIFVFTKYNSLQQYMDTKSLSFCQVYWGKKFFCNDFQIDYF